ncbi:MAG: hypothetical protein A2041_08770 [Bacteroidetes bacterium GWA2_31_9b]|nr:MAG: hypothetical protein A2041_08770 [Bacteroidetes bacterium GWA2_31_9b]
MLNEIFLWINNHFIEVLGTIIGILYIFLSIKQNIWCWPAGLITSLLYVYVFFISKFYADMGLQVYYVFVSIYGWYFWKYGGTKNNIIVKVSTTSFALGIKLFFINAVLFGFIAFILVKYTDSPLPYWDAFTTALSIVATWMLARKIIEHWILWVLIDSVSLALYFYKELYSTVILFAIYTVLAIIGYLAWRKDLKKI